MRILYVEDNPANLFLVKRVARMGNHEVLNYIDGEEALRNFDRDKPDLVLMDIQLAGELTGLEVVKKLRDAGHSIPIVTVTAYAMLGDRERCIKAGCDDYLAKPLPVPQLVELFERYAPKPEPVVAPTELETEMDIAPISLDDFKPAESAPPTAASDSAPETSPAADAAPTSPTDSALPPIAETESTSKKEDKVEVSDNKTENSANDDKLTQTPV